MLNFFSLLLQILQLLEVVHLLEPRFVPRKRMRQFHRSPVSRLLRLLNEFVHFFEQSLALRVTVWANVREIAPQWGALQTFWLNRHSVLLVFSLKRSAANVWRVRLTELLRE